MADHKTLVHIWRFLNQGKNVLVFIDSELYDYGVNLIGKWFQPIVKERLNFEELVMRNGTFLIFRRLLWGVNEATRGAFEIVALSTDAFDDVINSLEKK